MPPPLQFPQLSLSGSSSVSPCSLSLGFQSFTSLFQMSIGLADSLHSQVLLTVRLHSHLLHLPVVPVWAGTRW